MFGFTTYADWAFYALQAVVGIIFIVHGWPKIKNPSGIASALGVPKIFGTVQGLVEVLGGLALILNFYIVWVAAAFSVIMLGAIYFKIFRWKTGFMAQNSTGWEFDLLLLAVFVTIFCRGW